MRFTRTRGRTLAAIAASAVAVSVAGCGGGGGSDGQASDGGGSPTSGTTDRNGELQVGLPGAGSGAGFDPGKRSLGAQNLMWMLAYESLTRQDPDGTVSPGLATSWRFIGKGNKVFELTLRDDARFSDGSPVDADAVKGYLEYFLKTNGYASRLGDVKKIEAVDKRTVRLTLGSGNPELPTLLSDQDLAGGVAAPKAIAQPSQFASETAGAGPYVLDPSDTVTNDHYTFVPNKYYYDESAIRFSKVRIKVISDANSMLQAAATGQLDVAYGDFSGADAASKADLNIATGRASTNVMLIWDRVGKLAPPLADVRVRQALNYAIDRDAIAKAIVGKYGSTSSELLTADGFDEAFAEHYSYDPETAKQLLAEAGFGDGFTLKLVYQSYFGNQAEPVVQAAAKYLSEVGVKLDLTAAATQADFGKLALSKKYPLTHTIYESAPMSVAYQTIFAPDAPINTFHAEDPVLQGLFAKASAAADPDQYWKQMSDRIVDQALAIPLFTADYAWFSAKDIDGVKLSASAPWPNPTAWTRASQ